MQLDVVQTETVDIHKDVFFGFVDKNTDTFGKRRQVPGYLVQVSGGFGVEDKTDHIYT